MAQKNEPGYIYALSNPCFSYLKIGHTKNDPQDRCDQLSRSQAIPFPFEVGASFRVMECYEGERLIHTLFADKWVGKEFYNVTIDEFKSMVKAKFDYAEAYFDYMENLMRDTTKDCRGKG